ncbi:MAG: hypothetical protein K0S61_104 [Anaerocolumna sp.]|jgi:hypothetical protein|nr:hypothetical protein [Anaerocolumna sp.]
MIILITYLLIGVVYAIWALRASLNKDEYIGLKDADERLGWKMGCVTGMLIVILFWSIILILNHIGLYCENKNNKEA